MSRRELPARRAIETINVEHAGQTYLVSVGRYPLGRDPRPTGPIGEVFIQARRTSSEAEAIGRDAAILISRDLQKGAAIDDIRHSMTRDESGQPASLVTAVLDAIAREWPDHAMVGLANGGGDGPA